MLFCAMLLNPNSDIFVAQFLFFVISSGSCSKAFSFGFNDTLLCAVHFPWKIICRGALGPGVQMNSFREDCVGFAKSSEITMTPSLVTTSQGPLPHFLSAKCVPFGAQIYGGAALFILFGWILGFLPFCQPVNSKACVSQYMYSVSISLPEPRLAEALSMKPVLSWSGYLCPLTRLPVIFGSFKSALQIYFRYLSLFSV